MDNNLNPKISIIMGVYNVKSKTMLIEAVQSILNQTFRNFEFIICDDGSDNNTYEMIEELSNIDNRIKAIKNDNNYGLAYTLNKCLNIASGEYIARMDCDDYSIKSRLEEEVRFLDENKEFSIVGCNANLFNESGIFGERINIEKPLKRDFLFGSRFIHPTIMVRKEVYDELGGYRVSKETIRGQDYDFFMRAYAMGKRGYNIQKKLYSYREDKSAYKRRTYRNRINEAIVRYKGFKAMKMKLWEYIYVLKPLLIGLIPASIMRKVKEIVSFNGRLTNEI